MLTGEKIDAHKALYEYQTPSDAILSSDSHSLLKNLAPGGGLPEQKLPPIPVLVAEGLRETFSIDTVKNNKIFLETKDERFGLEVIGMMSKTGLSGFTERKVTDGFNTWGMTVQTTYQHFVMLVE